MSKSNFLSKKSWHARSTKNVAKVHAAELAHEEKQKKLIQRQKELTEERELEELKRLHAISSGIPYTDSQIDWIYKTPVGDQSTKTNEEYLLGKTYEIKKEDNLIHKSNEAGGSLFVKPKEIFPGQKEPDLKTKIRNDPLLLMTMKELQHKKQMRNSMIKLELLKAKEEKFEKIRKKRNLDEYSSVELESYGHASKGRKLDAGDEERGGEGHYLGERRHIHHYGRHHHQDQHHRHRIGHGGRERGLDERHGGRESGPDERHDGEHYDQLNQKSRLDEMIRSANEIYKKRDHEIQRISEKREKELKNNSRGDLFQPEFISEMSSSLYKNKSVAEVLTSNRHYLKYRD